MASARQLRRRHRPHPESSRCDTGPQGPVPQSHRVPQVTSGPASSNRQLVQPGTNPRLSHPLRGWTIARTNCVGAVGIGMNWNEAIESQHRQVGVTVNQMCVAGVCVEVGILQCLDCRVGCRVATPAIDQPSSSRLAYPCDLSHFAAWPMGSIGGLWTLSTGTAHGIDRRRPMGAT